MVWDRLKGYVPPVGILAFSLILLALGGGPAAGDGACYASATGEEAWCCECESEIPTNCEKVHEDGVLECSAIVCSETPCDYGAN